MGLATVSFFILYLAKAQNDPKEVTFFKCPSFGSSFTILEILIPCKPSSLS